MSFFSKLKSALWGMPAQATAPAPGPITRGPSWRVVLTAIGATNPTCPHCGHTFEKMPQRKRSCPECGGVFYSRKRAFDGTKVLLTEAQAREGEAQAALLALTQESLGDSELDALVATMKVQLGRVPTPDELVIQHLVRSAAVHAEAWNWGLYRNARFSLAEACTRQRLSQEALRLLLEVSLIDLNGPRNCGTKDPEILRRSAPPFDPKTAFLAAGVISRTVDVIAKLDLSPEDVRHVFETVANSVGPVLKLPRSPSSAWRELSKAFADVQA